MFPSEQIQQLYIAYYGYPADPQGLESYKSNTRDDIADNLSVSEEFQNLNSDNTTGNIITRVYQYTFGRGPSMMSLITIEKQ